MTMEPAIPPAIVRVPHPELSLWQSSVRQVVANHVAAGDIRSAAVESHHLVQQADQNALDASKGLDVRFPAPPIDQPVATHRLFALAVDRARAVAEGADTFAESIGKFGNLDPLFVDCLLEYAKWYLIARARPQYREAAKHGPQFGIVDRPIPNNARVAIIGDWGTGLPDAEELLRQLLAEVEPDVLIHLGDVYYSGTPLEVHTNFTSVIDRAMAAIGRQRASLLVYAVPGNHDYYSGGLGFYSAIDQLNDSATRQQASYFCLRSDDNEFQFVGMDTGYHDRDLGARLNSQAIGPGLEPSELTWVKDKLAAFTKKTILLSHHQVFSANSAINGSSSERPYLNVALAELAEEYTERIAAWFWGHEHSLWIHASQFGVQRGRLVGCSAFEMAPEDDPYAIRFSSVKLREPIVMLSKMGDWYSHGCAVVDLAARTISYYEIPAWTGSPPPDTRISKLEYVDALD